MSPEDFRNITQGIQAIVLAVAAGIGGIWVLLRFGLTRERARAQLEVEKNRLETQRLKWVSCEISVRHVETGGGRFSVYADATLLNHGSDVRGFRVDAFPFHINRVTVQGKQTSYAEVVRLRIEDPSADVSVSVRWPVSLLLFPDTPHRLSFFYELNEPGTYMFSLVFGTVDFEAKSDKDKAALQNRWKAYDEYKSHPLFSPNPKLEFVINKHHYVGPRSAVSSASNPYGKLPKPRVAPDGTAEERAV